MAKDRRYRAKDYCDSNFEGMAFIVLDYIFTKSVQSKLCFTLRKPAHATYSDFFTAVKITIFSRYLLIIFIFLLKTWIDGTR